MIEQCKTLTGRNLKLYFRDKGTVLFSLLSMLIVIGLMMLFLGDIQTEELTDILKQIPGHDPAEDEKNAKLLILSWTCAGILSINAATVSLSTFSAMIKDKTGGKLPAIYTAPVSRGVIALGYVLAAWMASVLVCLLTLAVTESIGVLCGMEWFSVMTHIRLTGMIMVNSFAYASCMYVAAVLIQSQGAWSGLGTIVGTLTGFLGGIYLPIGQLSKNVAGFMKCTPMIYGTAMFRDLMTSDIVHATFHDLPQEAERTYREMMGIDLFVFDRQVTVGMSLTLLLIFGAIFLMIGAVLVKYGRKTDR